VHAGIEDVGIVNRQVLSGGGELPDRHGNNNCEKHDRGSHFALLRRLQSAPQRAPSYRRADFQEPIRPAPLFVSSVTIVERGGLRCQGFVDGNMGAR
jgi:hypothetical protein